MGFWNSDKKSEEESSEGKTPMSEAATIDFGDVLDISFAAKFHAQLKDEVEKNSTVNFITSELTRIDASCLQVLASFMGYAKENAIKVEWGEPGDVIKEATRLTGLTEVLKLNH
ncbi:MAG: hypothetical protein BMS9Abin31_1232 [Gammaproteobacteria bacterium]|nr:MAG: hypothetical protein BMS9Abin31_1232 [Gammaproteobacteria bacterium]